MSTVDMLIELASLQTAFLTLDNAIKTTNRRVNALDNVVIPKLNNTISYIKVCLSSCKLLSIISTQCAEAEVALLLPNIFALGHSECLQSRAQTVPCIMHPAWI